MTTISLQNRRPQILVTNDDGITSPGLWLMVKELATWSDVYVVAPSEEQSATSLSITVRNPLSIHRHYDVSCGTAWSVSGTPADCVKTALSILLKNPPDIVVSGINKGSNAGKNVLYSGTIGGAIEASLRGLQAIAFSSYSMSHPSFEAYAPLTSQMIQYALKAPASHGIVLNVNFPCQTNVSHNVRENQVVKGIKLTRQGKEYILEKPKLISAPRKEADHHETTFHMGVQLVDSDINDETTDIYWLKQGYATCVPVFVEDLTHSEYMMNRKKDFESLF